MAETFFWIVVFGAIAVMAAATGLLLIERNDRLDYLERLREDAAHDREMERRGKSRHCDGWAVWWQ